MRIAVVHNFYRSLSPSGENEAVKSQVRALTARGHTVKLFARHSDDLKNTFSSKFAIGLNVATGLRDESKLVEEINNFGPDIIHIHNLFPTFGSSWLKNTPYPVVATLHNFRTICSNGLLSRSGQDCNLCLSHGSFQAIKHKCYGSVPSTLPLALSTRGNGKHSNLLTESDALITLSDYSTRVFRSIIVDQTRIHKVPNFAETDSSPSENFDRLNRWLYVGRLSAEKGIQELVSNWPSDKDLVVCGDGHLRQWLLNEISTRPEITYLGPLTKAEVAKALKTSQGLVFPSTCRENAPMIYVEALSAGTPVAAFHANSVADSVLLEGTGLVFKDWSELSETLYSLESQLDAYSAKARIAVDRYYSESSWVEAIERVYSNAVLRNSNSSS